MTVEYDTVSKTILVGTDNDGLWYLPVPGGTGVEVASIASAGMTIRPTPFHAGTIVEGRLDAQTLGLPRASLDDLRGGEVVHNAKIAQEILSGTRSAARDVVAANAGCAIYVADQVASIAEGVTRANMVLDSGRVLRLLEQVRGMSAHA